MSRDDREDYGPMWDDEPDWLKEPAEEEYYREGPRREPAPADEWDRVREGYAPDEARYAPVYDDCPEEDDDYIPRRRRGGTGLLIGLIVLLVLGMAFAGYQLGSIFMNYRRDRSAYSELASNAISELPVRTAAPEDAGAQAGSGRDVAEITVSQVPISVDWDYLRSVNSDVVGWLYCPGTIINYPVVQNPDNEYYLKHGFDRQSNVSGAIFADAGSVIGSPSSNLVIYGHNMKDKSMFGSFQAYVSESYCDENPSLYLLTPDRNYRIDLFGTHIKEGTVDNFPTFFGSTEAYQSYLDSVTSSFYWIKRDVINTNYQLVTLTTCTSASGYSDARLLIHGVLIPIE